MTQPFKLITGGCCPLQPVFDPTGELYPFPASFSGDFGELKVQNILDQWPNGTSSYFRISTAAEETLIVHHSHLLNRWEIIKWIDS